MSLDYKRRSADDLETTWNIAKYQNLVKMAEFPEELAVLHDEIAVEQHTWIKTMFAGIELLYNIRTPWSVLFHMINDRLQDMVPGYGTVIITSDTEVVNGYKLYNTESANGVIGFADLSRCIDMQRENRPMNYATFEKRLEDVACADWYKMDFDGQPCSWDGTFVRNCQALYALPYAKELVLWTVQYSCTSRKECVRYSNFCCEWVRRKSELISL